MQHDAFSFHVLRAGLDHLGQTGIEGVGEPDVANDTALEEGKGADALGPIDDLVGNYKVHGLDLLPQRTDSRKGDDAADANVAQSGDVGAVRDLVGRKLVVQAVSSEEGDIGAVVGEDVDGRRWRTPGRHGVEHSNGLEAIELAKAGASDDGDVDGLWRRRRKR